MLLKYREVTEIHLFSERKFSAYLFSTLHLVNIADMDSIKLQPYLESLVTVNEKTSTWFSVRASPGIGMVALPDAVAAELGELRLVDEDQPGILLISQRGLLRGVLSLPVPCGRKRGGARSVV